MIVLDTNIVSVFAQPRDRWPDPLAAWLADQRRGSLYLTTVTRAEVAYGVAVLPDGKRKHDLAARVARLLADLEPYTLPFDVAAADAYGDIAARRRAAGRPISTADAQIAAVATVQDATVATRNTKDFDGLGLVLVNPYGYRPS
ncbi:MAG: type II toxin-antitoxin system VapC family toxin [Micrococcales bacterium]|nr:type II toxin-antitoxin system VapC family toxin [Micrococcales bacterium]